MISQKQDEFYLSLCLIFTFSFGFSLANSLWMFVLGLENIPYNIPLGISICLVLWIIFGRKLSFLLDVICEKIETRKKGANT